MMLEFGTVVDTPLGRGIITGTADRDYYGADHRKATAYRVEIAGRPLHNPPQYSREAPYSDEIPVQDCKPVTGQHTVTLSEWLESHRGGYRPFVAPKLGRVPKLTDKMRAALYQEFELTSTL